jgi:hypothetical protein
LDRIQNDQRFYRRSFFPLHKANVALCRFCEAASSYRKGDRWILRYYRRSILISFVFLKLFSPVAAERHAWITARKFPTSLPTIRVSD